MNGTALFEDLTLDIDFSVPPRRSQSEFASADIMCTERNIVIGRQVMVVDGNDMLALHDVLLSGVADPVGIVLDALRFVYNQAQSDVDDWFMSVAVTPEAIEDSMVRYELERIEAERIVVEVAAPNHFDHLDAVGKAISFLKSIDVRSCLRGTMDGLFSPLRVFLLTPDLVEIDGDLVSQITADQACHTRAKEFIDCASLVGAKVLGRGVTHASEALALRELGVDCMQGAHIGEPVRPLFFDLASLEQRLGSILDGI